jgi:hypothetical protein
MAEWLLSRRGRSDRSLARSAWKASPNAPSRRDSMIVAWHEVPGTEPPNAPSRRDSMIVAWHEVPGTEPPKRAVP